jgi:hypothetical protein
LLGFFQYTRYGNERFDYFTKGDLAAVQAFYRLAPVGSTVYAGNGNAPWQYRDYASYNYHSALGSKEGTTTAAKLAAQLRSHLVSDGGGYVLITRSMEIATAIFDNQPHILDDLVATLRTTPGFREVYRNPDGDLFYLSRSHSG